MGDTSETNTKVLSRELFLGVVALKRLYRKIIICAIRSLFPNPVTYSLTKRLELSLTSGVAKRCHTVEVKITCRFSHLRTIARCCHGGTSPPTAADGSSTDPGLPPGGRGNQPRLTACQTDYHLQKKEEKKKIIHLVTKCSNHKEQAHTVAINQYFY